MFSFLRTSRSLWKSRRSQNPDLRFYRVTFRPYLSPRRWGLPIVSVGMAAAVIYYNNDLVEKIGSREPFYMPLWFAYSSKGVSYEQDGPEIREYKELMKDARRRVNAEDAVLQAVKKRILMSTLNLGQWEGFSSPFWMTFQLTGPGIVWHRKYLAISLSGIDIVERPVPNRNIMRLTAAFYPAAMAAGLQAFTASIYSSVLGAVWPASQSSLPPRPPSPFRKPDPQKQPSEKEQRIDVPLLPSSAMMVFHEAAEKATMTLMKQMARDYQKNLPAPPRGWIVADGTVRLVGSEMALILDFRVAFNPKNFSQNFVYDLNPRYHTARGGMMIQTFEKPGLPPQRPPPPKAKQPQQQQQKQQRVQDREQPQQEPQEQGSEPLQKPAVSVEPPTVPPEQQQQQPGQSRPQQEQEVPRKR